MPYCPRCRNDQPEWMFQKPVSFCMTCYSMLQANTGLTLDVLKTKASKSRYAARKLKQEEWMRNDLSMKNMKESLGGLVEIRDKYKGTKVECWVCKEMLLWDNSEALHPTKQGNPVFTHEECYKQINWVEYNMWAEDH